MTPSLPELLQRSLARKKELNPSYSLRAFARDLGLSVSYVSNMMKGKKPFPAARFEQIATQLGMDDLTRSQLGESILQSSVQKSLKQLPLEQSTRAIAPRSARRKAALKYIEASQGEFAALEHWHTIALLDLVSCKGFTPDPAWVSKRLGITPKAAESSWRYLLAQGLVALRRDGTYRKTKFKLRYPTARSQSFVRAYHRQMIGLALQELQHRTDPQSFDKRLITGITFASNPRNLRKAKMRLTETLYEISELLSQGECTELYQLNLQLFPLTR